MTAVIISVTVADKAGHLTQGQSSLTINDTLPPPAMMIGLNTESTVPWDTVTARGGRVLDIRHHYESNVPTSWVSDALCAADAGMPNGPSRCATIGSVKPGSLTSAQLTTNLTSYLRSVPTWHRYYLIVHHEPEDDSFGSTVYKGWQTTARSVVNAVNLHATGGTSPPREVPIKFGGTLMATTADGFSGRNVAEWLPPAGTWDFLGWDGYDKHGLHVPPLPPEEASSIFANAVTWNQSTGLPFLVIETGTPDYNADRVGWLGRSKTFCRSVVVNGQPAIAYCYYNKDLADTWLLRKDEEYVALAAPVSTLAAMFTRARLAIPRKLRVMRLRRGRVRR